MKKIVLFGVSILMLCMVSLVFSGGALVHVLCDHCEVSVWHPKEATNATCCQQNKESEPDCTCKYAHPLLDAEETYFVQSDIRFQTLRWVNAVYTLHSATDLQKSDVIGWNACLKSPNQLKASGRDILRMNSILRI